MRKWKEIKEELKEEFDEIQKVRWKEEGDEISGKFYKYYDTEDKGTVYTLEVEESGKLLMVDDIVSQLKVAVDVGQINRGNFIIIKCTKMKKVRRQSIHGNYTEKQPDEFKLTIVQGMIQAREMRNTCRR